MIQKWKKLKKNEKGLTLIELLAVLVILGIIAAIVIPLIANVISDSRDKAILADASNIISAAKLAHANGEGTEDNTAGTITFKKDILSKYMDKKVKLANDDKVTYTKSSGEWTIKYSNLKKIKNEDLKTGLGISNNDDETTDDLINDYLDDNAFTNKGNNGGGGGE